MAMPTEKTCYDGGEHEWESLGSTGPESTEIDIWCNGCGSTANCEYDNRKRIWNFVAPTCHADYVDREDEDAESQG